MKQLKDLLVNIKTVVLLGHIRPDGDCIGAGLGLYNYLQENYPEIAVDLYLDLAPLKFSYLDCFDQICCEWSGDKTYDLCICLDCGDRERLGKFEPYFAAAEHSLCIDHHISNRGYADENIIQSEASSTCEVLFDLIEVDKVSKATAKCLYTGIIHDTGVFKYSNTSPKTLTIAAQLVATGIDFTTIIEDSFYKKTYIQNQILGRALLESVKFLKGQCIFSVIRKKEMEFYGATNQDFDGVVEQLRCIEGIECAIFMYETGSQEYKVSLRSSNYIDVSKVAGYFGGGGHIRASGCTMAGSLYDVVNNLASRIEMQLK